MLEQCQRYHPLLATYVCVCISSTMLTSVAQYINSECQQFNALAMSRMRQMHSWCSFDGGGCLVTVGLPFRVRLSCIVWSFFISSGIWETSCSESRHRDEEWDSNTPNISYSREPALPSALLLVHEWGERKRIKNYSTFIHFSWGKANENRLLNCGSAIAVT